MQAVGILHDLVFAPLVAQPGADAVIVFGNHKHSVRNSSETCVDR